MSTSKLLYRVEHNNTMPILAQFPVDTILWIEGQIVAKNPNDRNSLGLINHTAYLDDGNLFCIDATIQPQFTVFLNRAGSANRRIIIDRYGANSSYYLLFNIHLQPPNFVTDIILP